MFLYSVQLLYKYKYYVYVILIAGVIGYPKDVTTQKCVYKYSAYFFLNLTHNKQTERLYQIGLLVFK